VQAQAPPHPQSQATLHDRHNKIRRQKKLTQGTPESFQGVWTAHHCRTAQQVLVCPRPGTLECRSARHLGHSVPALLTMCKQRGPLPVTCRMSDVTSPTARHGLLGCRTWHGWPHSLLRGAHHVQQCVVVDALKGLTQRPQLPQHNAKAVHILRMTMTPAGLCQAKHSEDGDTVL
jgi:hypothetical protein